MNTKFVDANNIPYSPSKWLDFSDVLIRPYFTNLESVNDPAIDFSTRCGEYKINSPVVFRDVSNTTPTAYSEIKSYGTFGFLKKTWVSIDELLLQLKAMSTHIPPSFEIGVHPSDVDVIDAVISSDIKNPQVYIQSPNGESKVLIDQIRRVKAKFGASVHVSAGIIQNVYTALQAISMGCNNVIIGHTKNFSTNTPLITNIINMRRMLYSQRNNATLTIYTSSDNIIKSLVAGADCIMLDHVYTNIMPTIFSKLREEMFYIGASKVEELFNDVMFIEK